MLHYTITGSGPIIVLVHGFLSDSRYWRTLTRLLEKKYQVVSIDLLGFGRSPKPRDNSYDLTSHAAALEATIRHITNQPVILVGHSMGALISCYLAQKSPKLISHLILCNMPLFTSQQQAKEVLAATGRLYRIMLYSSLARLLWPIVSLLLATTHRSSFSRRHTHTSRHRSLTNTIEATTTLTLLSSLQIPATLINGRYDRSVYRENLQSISLPHTVSVVTAKTGHHTPLHQPGVIINAIARSMR